nr:hypothetical protein [Tanacetum cinerariifolium]GEV29871.1 hypothetical protein [Tanacetum cinerariifolium]
MEYYETKDDCFTDLETKYPAIVINDTSDAKLSREPTISPLDNNEIDFNISFNEFDDKHYMEEMAGFGAYWSSSERVIPDKGDLKDYYIEISSDKDFLGPVPSYVHIRDPVKSLCHRMIAHSIFGRGQRVMKVAMAGSSGAVEDVPAANEGSHAVLAPMEAP